ncbi:MAG: ABC transporter ATP-binding protein, partial [Clostridia bacterium]|nr:ABC transporter ATP-binding protein [Clostridia bacterium]
MNEQIICHQIGKSYGKKEVLKNIELTLEPHKIYGLIGRNGAGKTTLLSIISAQNDATTGSVTIGEAPVWENEKNLGHICFSRELNTMMGTGANTLRIKDYLLVASLFLPNWDQKMAAELLKEFELNPKEKIHKLSKGMLSMVTILIALASKADYTLLDEPVAGLDVVMREKFYQLLLDEYANTERTFIISTHIIEEAAALFEEVIFLRDGGILIKENTDHLLERSIHVTGKEEDIRAIYPNQHYYAVEHMGRSMGCTLLLESEND